VTERGRMLANDARTAFDAGMALGVAYGSGWRGGTEAEAAKAIERIPSSQFADEAWTIWQRKSSGVPFPPPDYAPKLTWEKTLERVEAIEAAHAGVIMSAMPSHKRDAYAATLREMLDEARR